MKDIEKLKKVMFDAADEASNLHMEYFEKDIAISRKQNYSDLVTEVDKKAEAKIAELIYSSFPDHNILGEEGDYRKKESDYLWIVDPIDGTVNYTHSIPIFCVSIGLEYKGELIIGIVQSAATGEKFYAEKGKGAFLNGKQIKVSNIEYLKDSLLVTGFPYGAKDNSDHCIDHFVNFLKLGLPIRRLGSAALDICWLACGRFEAFWEVNLNAWDVAAGCLILTEAGGRVTNFKGEPYSIYGKQILASNGKSLHKEMMDVLSTAYLND